jgi:hypothetical protein
LISAYHTGVALYVNAAPVLFRASECDEAGARRPDSLHRNKREDIMRIKPAAALSAAVAIAVMALNVTTATARTLSIGPSQQFRETFNDIESSFGEIRNDCRLTLEGSLHARTIAKVAGALLGYITRFATGQCTQGTTILTETLPWHVRYAPPAPPTGRLEMAACRC